MKLTYNDQQHSYYLDGKRAKSVTAVAKIPTDGWAIQKWHERMTAIGVAVDANLRENIACHIDNRQALNDICEEAKKVAKAHEAADRGTQMHRVLELVLLEQEQKLMTDQQRRDADTLKRTLDRYKLTPYDCMAEQFVAWPEETVTGRFDCILEKPDGALVLVDLKSGPNAVTYPHSTAVQLALYARAPHISDNIHTVGDKSTVTDWRTMPERLNLDVGYVLLVQPDDDVGTLYELDIEHGWTAGQLALQIVTWQKQYNWGRDLAQPAAAPAELTVTELIARIVDSPNLNHLRELWNTARDNGMLTPIFKVEAEKRAKQLAKKGAA